VNADLIRTDSEFLKSTEIFCMDYKEFLEKHARKGDFVYLDPPYHPVSKYSDFKRYTRDFFGENEQIELAGMVDKISSKGCKFMLSNSYSDLVMSLYSKYETTTVRARRNINKNPDGRGEINEVLVSNYGR
jgi:DNA adenine methylase